MIGRWILRVLEAITGLPRWLLVSPPAHELVRFRCEACQALRPEHRIAVIKTSSVHSSGAVIGRNVNYCTDRPECRFGAIRIADDFEISSKSGTPSNLLGDGW